RIDVEVVDAAATRLERGESRADEAAHDPEVRLGGHFPPVRTSSTCTSTALTRSPVRRSTSYATRLLTLDATSARLSPYSTTTWRSIATSPVSRRISIPRGRPRARASCPPSQPLIPTTPH